MTNTLLSSVATTMSYRDRDELDHAIGRLLLRFLHAHSVTLFRLVEADGITRVMRRVNVSREHGEIDTALTDKKAQPPALADIAALQECVTRNEVVQFAGPAGHLMTHFPIHSDRGVVGILVVDADTDWPSCDAELVRDILQIVKNHLALLDYGELDTLTGLLNRKTFEVQFEKLRQRLSVGEKADSWEPSWLALVDIDRFKSINDSHGHLFGDEVLLLVSQIMKRTFRGADQVFRFGGEEFVVVLDHTSDSGAQIAFERLRTAIEVNDFPQVGRVTLSVGYTRIGSRDISTACVERADAALYYAKNQGRNNVRNYETLIASGNLIAKLENDNVEMF